MASRNRRVLTPERIAEIKLLKAKKTKQKNMKNIEHAKLCILIVAIFVMIGIGQDFSRELPIHAYTIPFSIICAVLFGGVYMLSKRKTLLSFYSALGLFIISRIVYVVLDTNFMTVLIGVAVSIPVVGYLREGIKSIKKLAGVDE